METITNNQNKIKEVILKDNNVINERNKVIINGDGLDLTEAIKEKVYEVCNRIFSHSEDIIKIRVTLGKEGATGNFTAKGMLEIYGPQIIFTAKEEDMYKAIGEMGDGINRQLRIKSRKRKHKIHST